MKRVINIVEDEKDINNLVAQYLRKEGYEVHSYYTYEEASAHVVDDDVHLWILDIMLDDKSGFDLIEKSGSWYSYNGEKIGQGMNAARKFMEANPDIDEEITERIKAAMFTAED